MSVRRQKPAALVAEIAARPDGRTETDWTEAAVEIGTRSVLEDARRDVERLERERNDLARRLAEALGEIRRLKHEPVAPLAEGRTRTM